MTDVVLNNITSGYNISKINDNFSKLQTVINEQLAHLIGGNNILQQDLDVNSNSLLNVNSLSAVSIKLNGQPVILTNVGTISPDAVGTVQIIDGAITVEKIDPAYDASLVHADDLTSSGGSNLVGFLQSGTDAVVRTMQEKERDRYSVKDFGAKGDGVTDDTIAISKALSAMANGSRKLFFPSGTYMVSSLTFTNTETTMPMVIEGEGQYATIIKKISADATPLLTLGSSTATVFSGNINIHGIQFKAASTVNPAGLRMYDVVASHFTQCRFTGFNKGVESLGGITNTFERCRFDGNVIGARFDQFTSLAGGGHPNNIQLRNCTFTLNSTCGATIDGGRLFAFQDCDIENNGVVKGTDTGGIYVGPNMGNVVDSTGLHPGVIINGCWIEGNRGKSNVRFDSGYNHIIDTYFVPYSSAYVDNDIYITGGVYQLNNVQSETSLSPNVLESGLTVAGNYIVNCHIPNLGSYNPALTTIVGTGRTIARGGEVPVVLSKTSPVIQVGTAALSAGSVSVTFPTAFSSTPEISILPLDGTASVSDTFRVSTRSATGFTVKGETTANNASAQTAGTFSISWIAVGAG